MHRCAGFKADNTPCQRLVKAQYFFCFAHDPSKSQARKRIAAKGGKGNTNKELRDLKANLHEAMSAVREGILSIA
jgi:hypothetical protein